MGGALEVHASSLQDSLIDGMSFSSRPTASYILGRKSVSFPPQSGGVFDPAVLRLMRFSLSDSTDGAGGWLDGSTLRIAYVMNNKSEGPITFICDQASCVFRRARVLCGGVEIHDILNFNRVQQMFSLLQPTARRMNDVVEGFGSRTRDTPGNAEAMATFQATFSQPFIPAKLERGQQRRVLSQLLLPIFSAMKLLPLSLLGSIVLELELDNADACFSVTGDYAVSWEIVQPLILVDSLQIDPAFSSSYAKHFLSGKSLPISYHNLFSMSATLTDTNAFSLPIQRGFSRLSAIYVTFYQPGGPYVTTFNSPYPPYVQQDGTTDANRRNDTFNFTIQLGGDLKPVYQTDSVGELFYRLRMC